MGKIYTIPPYCDFLTSLYQGLHSAPSDLHTKTTIILPTKRASKTLEKHYLTSTHNGATLLPKIIPLNHVGSTLYHPHQPLAPPASYTTQILLITQHILQWKKELKEPCSHQEALFLAEELLGLFAEFTKEQIDTAKLQTLLPEALSQHFQQSLDFIHIVIQEWPKTLEQYELSDPAVHQQQQLMSLSSYWQSTPPDYPVIIAGSTGTLPATRHLIHTISQLEHGMVILPGLDIGMPDAIWADITSAHPQYHLKALIHSLHKTRKDIPIWPSAPQYSSHTTLHHYLTTALFPARHVGQWHQYPFPKDALAPHLSILSSENIQAEARYIALTIRQWLHRCSGDIALITRHNPLAKLVEKALSEWHFSVNNIIGMPLQHASIGTFFTLVSAWWQTHHSASILLQILKHPLTFHHQKPNNYHAYIERIERRILRGKKPAPGLSNIQQLLAKDPELLSWFETHILPILTPSSHITLSRAVPLIDIIDAHIHLAEALFGTHISSKPLETLWHTEGAEQLHTLFSDILASPIAKHTLTFEHYHSLFLHLANKQRVTNASPNTTRIHILTPQEARLHHYEVVIIGHLNEGSWPSHYTQNAWLSRTMRQHLGLSDIQASTSIAAHDFCQSLASSHVIYSYSLKDENNTILHPSCFLARLLALVDMSDQHHVLHNLDNIKIWYDKRTRTIPFQPIIPPTPKPPKHLRLLTLAATDIESLIKDPYAFYAKKILKLRELEPPNHIALRKTIGIIVHDVANHIHQLATRYQSVPSESDLATYVTARYHDACLNQAEQHMLGLFVPHIITYLLQRESLATSQNATIETESEHIFTHSITSDLQMTITARADRIEQSTTDDICIIDYKTGQIPSKKHIERCLAPQLPIEAWLIDKGNHTIFGGTPHALTHVKFHSRYPFVETDTYDKDFKALICQAEQLITELCLYFADDNNAYLSCPHSTYRLSYNAYEHLARVKEWQ